MQKGKVKKQNKTVLQLGFYTPLEVDNIGSEWKVKS